MRLIGQLKTEADARTFGDYLCVEGVQNEIESEKDGTWAIWVHSEDDLEKAKGLLTEFESNPKDAKYGKVAEGAAKVRAREKDERTAYEKRIKERRHLFRPITPYSFGPLTFVLICISVVVFILTKGGREIDPIIALFFSEVDVTNAGVIKRIALGLPEIKHGQLWRLITPIFIHFHFLHIFFNMLWLKDLGSMVESRQSSWTLAILVLVFGALSNLAQYAVGGPYFGGMSGVVYALIGYIWIRGMYDPGSGLYLHMHTVIMMFIWFFVCLSGVMGNIANMAHGAGLVLGMAWGWLSSLRYR